MYSCSGRRTDMSRRLQYRLAGSRVGRVVLHLAGLARDGRFLWHLRGIGRECT